jgi:hypothetical protein
MKQRFYLHAVALFAIGCGPHATGTEPIADGGAERDARGGAEVDASGEADAGLELRDGPERRPDAAGDASRASDAAAPRTDAAPRADAAPLADGPRTPDAAPACGPANCATGCCMGNQCSPGTTTESCGAAGGLCFACTAGQTCLALPGGLRACGAENYTVKLTSASVSPTNLAGEVWDTPADSGCFDCILGCCPPDVIATGLVAGLPIPRVEVTDTLSPAWNLQLGTISRLQLENAAINVTLLDVDNIPIDDPIGTCIATVSAADLAAGELRLTPANGCSVKVLGLILTLTRL